MAKADANRFTIQIQTQFLQADADERLPAVAAYAYSPGGRLLGQAAVDPKGRAQLELPFTEQPNDVRLLLGPAGSANELPALDELIRRGAVEQHLRIEPKQRALQLSLPLYPDAWRNWLLGLCLVKGTVLKRIVRDGVPVDFPVCHATVDIYEVDPLWIILPRLPLDVLAHLREILAGRVPPRPIPDPGPRLPAIDIGMIAREPGPLPTALIAGGANEHRVDAEALQALHAASGSDALRFAAISGSERIFQQALIDHAVLIRPILCWLYPRFVTMQLIGSAETDQCGHFRRFIFKGYNNSDQPDLYFKVRQRLFGFFDVTLYAPTPIACHTWWNYACGSEVTLHVTHPLAVTCKPCPPVIAGNNWVLFMAVGNIPLSKIYGASADLAATTTADNFGLAWEPYPDTSLSPAPWGGTLRPRLEFDNALRDHLGVTYYRLSWKRDGESDAHYRPLQAAINRHFAHMVGTELVLDAYPLGPSTVGGEGALFEIPPTIPPKGQWSIPDAVEDTASGKFDTVAADGMPILDGKVQLRLELFDAMGKPIDIAEKSIDYYVPSSTELGGTVYTTKADALGLVDTKTGTMVITLHVNNEHCTAAIPAPSNGAAIADACCGVLTYHPGANVTMPWQASHPHRFASYHFGVVRGARSVYDSSGPVGNGAFDVTRSVAHLMNDNLPAGCVEGGCTVAGFSENLYVRATATNGWSQQSQYDASAVRAFVLKPA